MWLQYLKSVSDFCFFIFLILEHLGKISENLFKIESHSSVFFFFFKKNSNHFSQIAKI